MNRRSLLKALAALPVVATIASLVGRAPVVSRVPDVPHVGQGYWYWDVGDAELRYLAPDGRVTYVLNDGHLWFDHRTMTLRVGPSSDPIQRIVNVSA